MTAHTFKHNPSPIPGHRGEEWQMDLADNATVFVMTMLGPPPGYDPLVQMIHVRYGCSAGIALPPDAARALADALVHQADVAEGIRP